MAAGKGTRMKDPLKAKVLYEILGKPMIHYVLNLAEAIHTDRMIVVVGHQHELVKEYIRRSHPQVEIVLQEPQLGTGHAVMQTEEALNNFIGDVLILSGDVPFLTEASLQKLMNYHYKTEAVATILTADLDNPESYGRIIRNVDGSVKKIVEYKDATEQDRAVKEINSGIYLFDKKKLFEGLQHITPNNVQNEYYLTDIFEYLWNHQWRVSALKAASINEILGINTMEQLEEARSIFLNRTKMLSK